MLSPCFLAAAVTPRYRARLSSMVQLMLDLEKDSDADAKTAISFAPAAMAASNPCKKRSTHDSACTDRTHTFFSTLLVVSSRLHVGFLEEKRKTVAE